MTDSDFASKSRPLNSAGRFRIMHSEAYQNARPRLPIPAYQDQLRAGFPTVNSAFSCSLASSCLKRRSHRSASS